MLTQLNVFKIFIETFFRNNSSINTRVSFHFCIISIHFNIFKHRITFVNLTINIYYLFTNRVLLTIILFSVKKVILASGQSRGVVSLRVWFAISPVVASWRPLVVLHELYLMLLLGSSWLLIPACFLQVPFYTTVIAYVFLAVALSFSVVRFTATVTLFHSYKSYHLQLLLTVACLALARIVPFWSYLLHICFNTEINTFLLTSRAFFF